jgi:hypothetical protein
LPPAIPTTTAARTAADEDVADTIAKRLSPSRP